MSEFILKITARVATKQDLLLDKGVLRYGTAYFLKSFRTGKVSGPYVLDKYTRNKELEKFFKHGYVFVAESVIDNDVELVLQTEFKNEQELTDQSA